MTRFTPDELRHAVHALATVEADGDPDEFSAIVREARSSTPSAARWDNATIGTRLMAEGLARRLSRLLDAPESACIAAAADVYGRGRGKAIYDALVNYAAELQRDIRIVPAKRRA